MLAHDHADRVDMSVVTVGDERYEAGQLTFRDASCHRSVQTIEAAQRY